MKVAVNKKHLIFSIAYFFTMLTLLLNQIEALPLAIVLRKTKYAYVALVIVLWMTGNRIRRGSWLAICSWSLFFIHAVLFGFVFNNTAGAHIAAENISVNVTQMIWYLLMVLATYLYVSQNGIFKLFITLSFYVTGLQLLIAAALHRQDFVNPVWGLIQSFTADIRYKTQFGFIHAGYLSNATYLVVVLSLFFFELYRHDPDKRIRSIMWISLIFLDVLALEMLMCAAERAGIISTLILLFIYCIFVFLRIRLEARTTILLIMAGVFFVFVMAAAGVFTHIWDKSNRALNITVNYPIFLKLGNIWTGMGFVDSSGFHEVILDFGDRTSSLDMYYVYIFFTTGIIGCILIGLGLMTILVKLFSLKKTDLNITAIALYVSWLFFAFWQCNMVTYRYPSPTILYTILLCAVSRGFCKDENT